MASHETMAQSYSRCGESMQHLSQLAMMGRLAIAIALLLALATPVHAATPKAGAKCTKAGITATAAGKKFTCIKSGNKLVWNKGVAIKAAPKPSPNPVFKPVEPTPSPTPAPTLIPTPTATPSQTAAPIPASYLLHRLDSLFRLA